MPSVNNHVMFSKIHSTIYGYDKSDLTNSHLGLRFRHFFNSCDMLITFVCVSISNPS